MTNRPAEPRPIRIDEIDLEDPLPAVEPDGYDRVWVVGRRRGVPRAIVELDPKGTPAQVSAQLASLLTTVPLDSESDLGAISESALPVISVVVPTIVARIDELDRCLAGIDGLDYPTFEVIVVDNRRTAPTPDPLDDLVGRRPHVRVVREKRPGISAARNAGVAASSGEVIAFTDDDVQVDPGWLRAFGARFVREPELQAVTGLILPAELETPAQIYFEHYYGGFSGERVFRRLTVEPSKKRTARGRAVVRDGHGEPHRELDLYGIGAIGAGASMAFRRSILLQLGGFDLALGTGTPARGGEDLAALIDVLWSGGKIGFEPAAVVHHKHRAEMTQLVHQLHGNGVGFTAMLTSLVARDPRHALALAQQLLPAVGRLGTQSLHRLLGRNEERDAGETAAKDHSFPPGLVLHELRGKLGGPAAYLRSRRATRHWEHEHASPAARPAKTADSQLSQLADHVRLAAHHALLSSVGGSIFLPGTARRWVFAAAGADMASPPGPTFAFAGSPRNLTVGADVYMNKRVYIEAVAPVVIGNGVALGMEVLILTSHHAIDESGGWEPTSTGRTVSIGDRVWIGARAIVLPGAVIEPDVIIAAGAVVTGRCQSGGLYAGVPARRIRELNRTDVDN